MLIIWKDDFSIDGGAIDADHRMIIQRINQIIVAIRSEESIYSIAFALKNLHRVTAAHFSREEALQNLVSFPDAEQHRQQHQKLLSALHDWVAEVNRIVSYEDFCTQNETLNQCKTFLYRWILGHILSHDMEMRGHMDATQYTSLAPLSIDELGPHVDFSI